MKITIACAALVAALLLTGCPDERDGNELTLSGVLEAAVDGGLTATSCYMWKGNVTEYDYAGMTDLASGTPQQVAANTMFRIASQSKMFYGAAISVLIAEGMVSYDGPVSGYISADIADQLTNGNVITVHQLMNHTSGLFDYLNDDEEFTYAVLADATKVWTIEEALAFAYGKPAANEPGAEYAYSNTNYLLIALIIQEVTGAPSSQFVRDRVIDPLGLHNTYIHGSEEYDRSKLARGYYSSEETGLVDISSTYGDMPGDGGMISTPADMAAFITGIISNDSYPTPETRAAFLEVFLPKAPSPDMYVDGDNYGGGIKAHIVNGEIFYTHGGDIPGYNADMYYFPESNKGFSYMSSFVSSEETEEMNNGIISHMYLDLFSVLNNM
ncbi:MAG: beta-lactamase family protein [Spirochaetales bacterium]|nr:beta-lactamase family protein [Spirochaetales bacterium]